MSKILLRASKSPFEPFCKGGVPKDHLQACYKKMNRDGTKNVGNLVFAHSVHKILSKEGRTIDLDDYALTLEDFSDKKADFINSEYDSFVIPLCNSFRKSYKETLQRMTHNLKKIKIPCVVVGVGAQFSLNLDFNELRAIKDDVKDFMTVLLDRCNQVGVRGDITKDYLVSLGFPPDRIEVIGCPSMFYNGNNLFIKKPDTLAKVAINLSAVSGDGINRFADYFNQNFKGVFYVPQVRSLMPFIAKGLPLKEKKKYTIEHRIPNIINEKQTAFLVDVSTWIDFMKGQSFSIGTRIHGNVVPLLAGCPAHVIVHDSRTLELSDYFGIPHTRIDEIGDFDVFRVFEESNYDALNTHHAARLGVLSKFLEGNGLSHSLHDDAFLRAYDDRVKTAMNAAPVAAAALSTTSFPANF